jgi:hypothetical protein
VTTRAPWLVRRVLPAAAGNALIAARVGAGVPFAAGKLGSVELDAVRAYLAGQREGAFSRELHVNAGVYPRRTDVFERFCEEYLAALRELDVLAVWFRPGEARVARRYAAAATPVELRSLEGYYHADPWTRRLEGRRLLVVSPFAASILAQHARREAVWPGAVGILPSFELQVLKVPFSAAIELPPHPDWLTALAAFRSELECARFDVALIGAGAWSLPLAAHAKRLGRCGIHLGGATQILFGIKGGRWDDHPEISRLYNHAWVRPSDEERPAGYQAVERGCYW